MKKILALVLAATMVLGICLMAGCGEKPVDTTKLETTVATTTGTASTTVPTETDVETTADTTAAGDTTAVTETEPVVPEDPMKTWEGKTKLPGFEDVDFRGKTFVIAGEAGNDDRWESGKEIYSEDPAPIQTAVRNRNKIVESLYNCTIKADISEDAGKKVTAQVASGKHEVDIFTKEYAVMSLATAGSCYNLYSLGIDFSNDWWDQNYVHTYTVKNDAGVDTLYSIVGDFALTSFSATHGLMFNKSVYDTAIAQDLGYDIYQLVRDGKWTMDIFVEMIKAAASDTSGNSEYHYSEGDIMGWLRFGHSAHAMHVASALPIFVNNNGVYKFQVEQDAAAWDSVVTKAIEVWHDVKEAETVTYTDVQVALESGKTLFGSEVIDVLERMKDADASFGLVPFPKYTESQENYAHYVDNHLFSYFVPTSVTELDELGKFFELYAAHSRMLVRTAWIDTYAYEYCGDADSAEMLDIILDSRTYDPGYLMFMAEGPITDMITNGKNKVTVFASKKAKTYNAAIATYVKEISDNKA